MADVTVIVPTLNAARQLRLCLDALGGHHRVLVIDGGSRDATAALARTLGATVHQSASGRGVQLAAGAALARTDWLLFVHADTVLDEGWQAEVATFQAEPANRRRVGVFRFALDDPSRQARRLEALVAWRTQVLALPYGDQGLLISRQFYDEIGGYKPMPLMEDVDIVRRIGRRRMVVLASRAVTSAERWQHDGWLSRSARNLSCLALYFAGVPPRWIARLYGR